MLTFTKRIFNFSFVWSVINEYHRLPTVTKEAYNHEGIKNKLNKWLRNREGEGEPLEKKISKVHNIVKHLPSLESKA